MSNYIHVKLAPTNWIGLSCLAFGTVVSGVALFVAAMVLTHPTSGKPSNPLSLPTYSQFETGRGAIEIPITAAPVNTSALNELKQGNPICVPCRQPQIIYPSQPVQYPTITPVQYPNRPALPSPPVVQPNPTLPAPISDKCQIALFLDSSPKSQQIRQWFDTDPQLNKLRSRCSFEVYTPDNALYRTRYASIVPANQFPVVLFLHSNGGHIHAAGGSTIPSSPGELYSDLRLGFEKSKSVREAQIPADGAVVKTRTYTWDDSIHPSMQLQNPNCPDGNCPVDATWRPGDRVRNLFDDVRDVRNTVLWANPIEIVIYIAAGIVVLLFFATLAALLARFVGSK
jgi:hypothetical protein